jgi:hypothetical protein
MKLAASTGFCMISHDFTDGNVLASSCAASRADIKSIFTFGHKAYTIKTRHPNIGNNKTIVGSTILVHHLSTGVKNGKHFINTKKEKKWKKMAL